MDDLISRQAAIDALDCINGAEEVLRALPSAQPNLQTTCNQLATDLISRQALCEYALNQKDKSVSPNDIMRFPSAQPEPHWIPVSDRLPEESGWHICTCHDGVSERVTFLKWQKRLKQWEKTGTRAYWQVIAWMPLPEAYKPNK